jgi:divalent metal cation (Fe/Co/Zn/Cd) transporter
VEIEVVLPGHLKLSESHDVALELQHKLEALPNVERAFVHVSEAAGRSALFSSSLD